MKNEAYERYLRDENYRAALLATARRERTEAIRSMIIEPLLALLRNPPRLPLLAPPKSPPRPQTRMLRRSYC